jgi:hypothetical protein
MLNATLPTIHTVLPLLNSVPNETSSVLDQLQHKFLIFDFFRGYFTALANVTGNALALHVTAQVLHVAARFTNTTPLYYWSQVAKRKLTQRT